MSKFIAGSRGSSGLASREWHVLHNMSNGRYEDFASPEPAININSIKGVSRDWEYSMTSSESVEDFIRRGAIQVCDPEPDPPVVIRPRYGNAQKNTLWRATNLDFNRRVAKALSGMVVAVNLLNIDKPIRGQISSPGDNAYDYQFGHTDLGTNEIHKRHSVMIEGARCPAPR